MFNRKIIVESLRIDNKDVSPLYGTDELKAERKQLLEAATEYIPFDAVVDSDGEIIAEGISAILDLLQHGTAGIKDKDGHEAINFMLSGDTIYVHFMYTDEDIEIDATKDALKECIQDAILMETFEDEDLDDLQDEIPDAPTETMDVIFKREFNEYTGETDILAVFPTEQSYRNGDELYVLTYASVGQHSDASAFYIDELEDCESPEEYASLKQELESIGYKLNVLNEQQAEAQDEAAMLKQDIDGELEVKIVNHMREFAKANSYDHDLCSVHLQNYIEEIAPEEFNKIYLWALDHEYQWMEPTANEGKDEFKTIKDVQKAVDQAKKKLTKDLKNGKFGENFGQDEVRAIRDRMPVIGSVDNSSIMYDIASRFADWCMNVTPDSVKNEATIKVVGASRRLPKNEDATSKRVVVNASNFEQYADDLKGAIAENYYDTDSIYPVFMALKDRINTEIDHIVLIYNNEEPVYFYVITTNNDCYDPGDVEALWDETFEPVNETAKEGFKVGDKVKAGDQVGIVHKILLGGNDQPKYLKLKSLDGKILPNSYPVECAKIMNETEDFNRDKLEPTNKYVVIDNHSSEEQVFDTYADAKKHYDKLVAEYKKDGNESPDIDIDEVDKNGDYVRNMPQEYSESEELKLGQNENKFRYDGSIKIKQITKKEWEDTPDDYKMIKDGKKYIMYVDDESHKTVLGRCEIVEGSVNESDTIDLYLKDIQKSTDRIKNLAENAKNRVFYRLKENVSYFGQEAEQKASVLLERFSDAEGVLEKLLNDIYNDILG